MHKETSSAITTGVAGFIVGLLLICVFFGGGLDSSPLQQSVIPWPSRPIGPDGSFRESGWVVSRGFGWESYGESSVFHDGLGIVHPNGACPFGPGCETVAATDGIIAHIGMDERHGQTVLVVNGEGQYEMLYGRLESYRHYVLLEGRVDDPYGRYPEWSDYAPIGEDPLIPGAESADISIVCGEFGPTFTLLEEGARSVFVYDAPGDCVTSVTWGVRTDDWSGWHAESPTSVRWSTEVAGEGWNARAMDVGVRFRASVVPPPPPPPPTPTPTPVSPAPPVIPSGESAIRTVAFSSGGQDRWFSTNWRGADETPALRVGDSCRPANMPCRWRVALRSDETVHWREASSASFAHVQSDANDAPPSVVISIDGDPSIGPGESNSATVVVTSPRYPITVHAHGDADLKLTTFVALTGQCTASGAGTIQCRSAPSESYGSVVLRVVVRLDAQASTTGVRHVQIEATHASATGRGSATFALRPRATPTLAPYPPPRPSPSGSGNDLPDEIVVIEIRPTPVASPPGNRVDCAPQQLVPLPGVVNPSGGTGNMKLAQRAALSFQRVRNEIIERTRKDPLERLADALRSPEFRSSKPGVARYSWHMTGRAIDVDLGYPWRRVREGSKWRLYVDHVDVTEIFERHGWRRIPDRRDSPEWWHYEFTEGLSWRAAMRQVWPLARLQSAFPEIAWNTVGCVAHEPDSSIVLAQAPDRCVPAQPSFASDISTAPGCGPPVKVGMRVRQLTDAVGFIAGPDLFFGLRTSGVSGSDVLNVCSDRWLAGLPHPSDQRMCWTSMVNPAEFMTFDADGFPRQLPPPDRTDEYVFGPERPPSGLYWSPNTIDGPYGGGRSGGSW